MTEGFFISERKIQQEGLPDTTTVLSMTSVFTTARSPQAKSAPYTTGVLGFWAGGRWMKDQLILAPAAPTIPVTHQGTAMTGPGTVMPLQPMADSARVLLLTEPAIMSMPATLTYDQTEKKHYP